LIQAITFKRFKRFRDQRIPIRPEGITLIAGGNNSGKSSVLHGLAIWEFCRSVLEAEKGHKSLLPGSRSQGVGLGVDEFSAINVPSLAHLWTGLAPHKQRGDVDGYTLRIQVEWCTGQNTKTLEFGLALANDRLFAKATSSSLTLDDNIPRIAYLPPFAGITDREQRMPGAVRRRRIGEGLAGAVLRNLLLDLSLANSEKRRQLSVGKTKLTRADLKDLRATDPWELLQQALRTQFGAELAVAPFSEEYHSYIRVTIRRGEVQGYRLVTYSRYKSRDLMVEGSGFLQWLSVFALAVDPSTDVLLLDEPDAHLHCSLQQQMMETLESLAVATSKQILIATHSTEILRSAPPSWILEMSASRSPRFLLTEAQKVGMFAGLGSDYAPKIDAIKGRKRLLLIEGEFDLQVLRILASTLSRAIPDVWVEWKHTGGHKERKQFFRALKDEIPDLVALSLRDRDDEPKNTVGDALLDKSHDNSESGFNCKKWRRRHIESYLLWPEAIASATGKPVEEIISTLATDHAIVVGPSFPESDAPDGLIDVRGKEVLLGLDADRLRVAESLPAQVIPADVIALLDELDRLAL